MSTIQEIMAELHAGEQAKQRVPVLEEQIKGLQGSVDEYARKVQALELRAKQREEDIAQFKADISRLREERDDASFRELEAQDRLATFEKAVGAAWGGLGNAINALHPPKPEPVAAPVADQSALSPTPAAGTNAPTQSGAAPAAIATTGEGPSANPPQVASASATDAAGQASVTQPGGAIASGTSGEGQSAPGPTVSQQAGTVGSSPSAGVHSAEQPAGASSNVDWKPSVEPKPVTDEAGNALPSTAFEELKHRPFNPNEEIPF